MDFGKLEDVPEFRFQNVARRCGIACWEGALELQESIARCSDRDHRGEEVKVSDVQTNISRLQWEPCERKKQCVVKCGNSR